MRIPLSQKDTDIIRSSMKKEWQWSSKYWHPLHPTKRTDVLALDSRILRSELNDDAIIEILQSFGTTLLYRLCEYDPSEQLTLDELPFVIGASEVVICPPDFSWVIYSSHESTITFGGAALIHAVQTAIPSWPNALWPSPEPA